MNTLAEEEETRSVLENDSKSNNTREKSDSKSSISEALRQHRRPSTFETVLQVLRRPSTVALDALHKRRGSPALDGNSLLQSADSTNSLHEHTQQSSTSKKKKKPKQCKDGNDAFVSVLSAFYAKLLFVIGIAFPVTEVISNRVSTHFYQGYYLYLYLGSLGFMSIMYMTLLKDKAIAQLIKSSFASDGAEESDINRLEKLHRKLGSNEAVRYGSFYLRLGAVAFGIGSMVYSGLEFAQYFELKEDSECHDILQAITPLARMILTLIQMQFIFLNSRQVEMSKYRGVARFGLMHMVAANLCEWIYVIVEETKHEIVHLTGHNIKGGKVRPHRDIVAADHDIFECRRGNVMGALVQDASPFLFPCTIEYSLICAVIAFEMWKTVKNAPDESLKETEEENDLKKNVDNEKPQNHLTVDCSNAHKGLFSGILVLVGTIISLIIFFVMTKDPKHHKFAVVEVYVWELLVYILTACIVLYGLWEIRFLKYKLDKRLKEGISLDNTLLVCAQFGTFVYCMFSTTACYFMLPAFSPAGMITEISNLIQSIVQTAFILDASYRRTETNEQYRHKPARQIVTFLLVANMSLWLINTLQRSRAEFRPTHLEFYGVWAWTIITHVSMPLAIFFRFHSTICLFEVWKCAYKYKETDNHGETAQLRQIL